MAVKEKSRKKQLACFGMRLFFFAITFILLWSYATYVLTPKYDYGICSMANLYAQPENSIDVLVVGTSQAYAGINTNVLWSQYGIAAYDLCSAEQSFWISYYMIKEALKTQHPQVILLDAKPAMYIGDYTKFGRVVLSTYGIRSLDNRIGAILACVKDKQDALGYVLGLPKIHGNYNQITFDDFIFPPNNGGRGASWKGFIEINDTVSYNRPSFVWAADERSINQKEETYVRKIFELAKSEGIEIMLFSAPYPDYPNDHLYYNTLWRIADEYGVSSTNYNHPDLRNMMNYTYDFSDSQHMNVKGSMAFSRRLGADLKKRYMLPDHRGEENYISYDECATTWSDTYPEYALLR